MMGNHAMSREQAEEAARAKRALDGSVARVEALLAHAHALGIPTASRRRFHPAHRHHATWAWP